MNIFITGASGYIGSALVKSLSKQFSIVAGSQKKFYHYQKTKILNTKQ